MAGKSSSLLEKRRRERHESRREQTRADESGVLVLVFFYARRQGSPGVTMDKENLNPVTKLRQPLSASKEKRQPLRDITPPPKGTVQKTEGEELRKKEVPAIPKALRASQMR